MKDMKIFAVLVVALVLLMASAISAYIFSHAKLTWQILGGVGVVALIGYLVLDFKRYKTAVGRKTTRYGLFSVFASILMLAIVIFANLIGKEYDFKKDFTSEGLHTLSEQSIKVVKNLDQPITFRVFIYSSRSAGYDKIFEKYTYHTDKIIVEKVDVDKDPLALQKFNVSQAGTIIVESDTRSARVENLKSPDDPKAEEKLTNAIIQVAKGEKRKIYFSYGHGEKRLTESDREGLSNIKETLENGRFDVQEILLAKEESIPPDADILIVAGPKSDFVEHELKLIDQYVKNGGKLFLMVDPDATEALVGFLTNYGVRFVRNKTIFERNPIQRLVGGNPLAPVVQIGGSTHEITSEMKDAVAIFPISTPVDKAQNVPQGYNVESLFASSAVSMEGEIKGKEVKIDQKTAKRGPISLAVAVSGKITQPENDKDEPEEAKPEKEFRMLVFGDSDFMTNQFQGLFANSDLFQNSLSWLAQEEDLIAIRPKENAGGKFEITEARMKIIGVSSIFLGPILMLLAALGVWIRRRRA